MINDAERMRLALGLGRRGLGRTSPNPPVGAVVVRGGQVVGRGYHHRAGMPHAEVEALRDAGARARGATLFVTLEPCNHHGRTPPCTEAVAAAGIRRVVVGVRDPNPDVAGNGLGRLRRIGLDVELGVEAAACSELIAAFRTTVIGFAATFLLPGRVGEVLRPYLLARQEGFSAAATLATVIIERILDMVTVLLLFGCYLLTTSADVGPEVKLSPPEPIQSP